MYLIPVAIVVAVVAVLWSLLLRRALGRNQRSLVQERHKSTGLEQRLREYEQGRLDELTEDTERKRRPPLYLVRVFGGLMTGLSVMLDWLSQKAAKRPTLGLAGSSTLAAVVAAVIVLATADPRGTSPDAGPPPVAEDQERPEPLPPSEPRTPRPRPGAPAPAETPPEGQSGSLSGGDAPTPGQQPAQAPDSRSGDTDPGLAGPPGEELPEQPPDQIGNPPPDNPPGPPTGPPTDPPAEPEPPEDSPPPGDPRPEPDCSLRVQILVIRLCLS